MGMDVYGLKFKEERERLCEIARTDLRHDRYDHVRELDARPGAYFRSNIWSWPGIMAAVQRAIDQDGLAFDTTGWHYNDGDGLKAQTECDQLADALEKVLAETDGVQAAAVMASAPPSQMGTSLVGVFKASGFKVLDCAQDADITLVREFVAFLRNCGGFEIL